MDFLRSRLVRLLVMFLAGMLAAAVLTASCAYPMQAQSVLEQAPTLTTPWQVETQRQLDALGLKAAFRQKSFTLEIPEGEYDFYQLRLPAHVSLVAAPSTTRSVRLRYMGDGDATLISMRGYGSRVAGFDLVAKNRTAPRLVAIAVQEALNAQVLYIRFAHEGLDTRGVMVAGRESIVVEKCEFRCSVPADYVWGDNVVFRDMDLGAATAASQLASLNRELPSTCVLCTGLPHQVVFDGSQTWQGGLHAIYGQVSAPASGQGLNLYNVRYEQSLSLADPDRAAVRLHFTDRKLENLLLVGCRWTDRDVGFDVQGVTKQTEIGCRLPGARK